MTTTAKSTPSAERFEFNRGRIYGILFLVIAIGIVLLFARASAGGVVTTFDLNPSSSATQVIPLPLLIFPTQPFLYGVALIIAFTGGIQLVRGYEKNANLVLLIVVLLAVVAFLAWAARDNTLNMTDLLSSTLLRATPIALAALSGVICERAAVINIGIEGMMLSGAFTATLFASIASNIWMWSDYAALFFGLITAMIVGALLGYLLALLAVRFKVDQIIAGTAINILCTGITSYLSANILGEFSGVNNTPIYPPVSIPILSSIPIIGPVLFEKNFLVYFMFFLIIATHVVLFYTRWGLRTRAVGENPKAADTLGIDVYFVRYVNVTLGGMVAGVAGAFLVLGSVGRFDELMTAGRGFIGLAAMIFGKWLPFGGLAAATIFGFADSLQTRLAILSVPIPSQFLLMAPYLVTIIVLAGVVGEAIPPAADGQPYDKD